tara:strand:- start:214 stop:372 length:159 start_codon:yes stop_codon:yes gene_type:complete
MDLDLNNKRMDQEKDTSRFINKNDCPVSKASKEIMLNRICENDTKVFPFLNN